MHRNPQGQLSGLSDRLTPHQATKRIERMTARAAISREHGVTRFIAASAMGILQRGIFGRLKWLLLGR